MTNAKIVRKCHNHNCHVKNSFSEAKASEILELAARYYTAENQGYTVKELIAAGTEAQISNYLESRKLN